MSILADGGDAATDRSVAGTLSAAALDERVAIVGTSASGKTYAAKGWVEMLLDAGARVCGRPARRLVRAARGRGWRDTRRPARGRHPR